MLFIKIVKFTETPWEQIPKGYKYVFIVMSYRYNLTYFVARNISGNAKNSLNRHFDLWNCISFRLMYITIILNVIKNLI